MLRHGNSSQKSLCPVCLSSFCLTVFYGRPSSVCTHESAGASSHSTQAALRTFPEIHNFDALWFNTCFYYVLFGYGIRDPQFEMLRSERRPPRREAACEASRADALADQLEGLLLSKLLTFVSTCACHPCAGATLIFSVSFHFYRMIPEGLLLSRGTKGVPIRSARARAYDDRAQC